MEDELGRPVFSITRRPISMTAPGRYLFEHASKFYLRVEEVRAMTRRLVKKKSPV